MVFYVSVHWVCADNAWITQAGLVQGLRSLSEMLSGLS